MGYFIRVIVTAITIVGFVTTLYLSERFAVSGAYRTLQRESDFQLQNFVAYLLGDLGRFENAPRLLSTNGLLLELLLEGATSSLQKEVNLYLEEIAGVTDAADIYLMDSAGTVLASSNWRTPVSYVGKNFAFRPYFQQAMTGKLGRFYGLGAISGKRGYYFATPIMASADRIGAIAVKVDIDRLEAEWLKAAGGGKFQYLVSDRDGVIFLSSQPGWRLMSMQPMSDALRSKLTKSQQYAGHTINDLDIRPLSLNNFPRSENSQLLAFHSPEGKRTLYLAHSNKMPLANWEVMTLRTVDEVEQNRNIVLLASGACYLLAVMVLLYYRKRAKNIQLLQRSREELENLVQQRTQDLTTSYQQLATEAQEKEKALVMLKETQDELVQAAKLAVVGQLSAGINHELNQPLAAMRTYAQTAGTLLEHNKSDKVSANLKQITKLCDHMGSIIGQFKAFSRKSGGRRATLNLQETYAAALAITINALKKAGVEMHAEFPESPLLIMGDTIRLEQVIINVMTNAVQAMEDCSHKRLDVNAWAEGESVIIEFHDSGPGIRENNLGRIFEPFFTTKEGERGLGLGLSISYRIIESMHGEMSARNHPHGGAVFQIKLPTAKRSKSEVETDSAHENLNREE